MYDVISQVEHLKNFVTDYKNELFERLVNERTEYITLVLEDLYQPHNCSAIIRSCDCFGVQNIHIIEDENEFQDNQEVSKGASDWITKYVHNKKEKSTKDILTELRSQGYRIVATTPHENDCFIDDIDLRKGKMAFFLGTELTGLSNELLLEADEFVKVPMYGFTESYNVSVCASLLLYSVVQRLRKTDINWKLDEKQKYEVLLQWYKKSVKASDQILERFNLEGNEKIFKM